MDHRGWQIWKPYGDVAGVAACFNGAYRHHPDWYYDFLYEEEAERGYEAVEDLFSPGILEWRLDSDHTDAYLLLRSWNASESESDGVNAPDTTEKFAALVETEQTRRTNCSTLELAARSYLVERGPGLSIIAGYPWFMDWGRDTFIALRGLCLATGLFDEAQRVLLTWADSLDRGMMPNRFTDGPDEPQYNSVDASLWFVVASYELLVDTEKRGVGVIAEASDRLREAIESILQNYSAGTRYSIHEADDGLLCTGEPGFALTWMDAIADGTPLTPRIGKPVEIQCLWLNALRIGGLLISSTWTQKYRNAKSSFDHRFWDPSLRCLYDVIDVDHNNGWTDSHVRPNQVFAVGGLPFQLTHGEAANAIVETIEQTLLTPMGIRSLSPDDPEYRGRYEGPQPDRDRAYHQGTSWPWLMGPFVEAWLRVRNFSTEAREEARRRFLAPLDHYIQDTGAGHLCEIADGDYPHTPRGCPFQAWSLGEFIRIKAMCDHGTGYVQS